MSRVNGFFVTLESDIKEEHTKSIQDALSMIQGVASVDPNPSDVSVHIAKKRMKLEVTNSLMAIIDNL